MAEALPHRSRDVTNVYGNDDGDNEDEDEADVDETVSTSNS